MRAHQSLTLLALSVLLYACKGSEPSHEAATDNIIADFRVETFDMQTAHAIASLRKQGFEYETLFLGQGDELLAQTTVDSTRLTFEPSDFNYVYEGDVNMDNSGEVTVSFLRQNYADTNQRWYPSDVSESQKLDDSFQSAPNSWVEIPPEFTLSSPVADTEYNSPDDIVTLRWSPTDAHSALRLVAHHINCDSNVDPAAKEINLPADAGAYNVAIHDLLNRYIVNNNVACEIELVMYREQRGTLDPHFSGGTFVGAYGQRVRLHYRPVL